MRKSCLECVLKHLGSASIYIEETYSGYPNYFGYVYGELDHAASECLKENYDLAMVIREHRIKWSKTRKEKNPHVIPFEALFEYIDSCAEAKGKIRLPSETYAGLEVDEDGNVCYSTDTRPYDSDYELD